MLCHNDVAMHITAKLASAVTCNDLFTPTYFDKLKEAFNDSY